MVSGVRSPYISQKSQDVRFCKSRLEDRALFFTPVERELGLERREELSGVIGDSANPKQKVRSDLHK